MSETFLKVIALADGLPRRLFLRRASSGALRFEWCHGFCASIILTVMLLSSMVFAEEISDPMRPAYATAGSAARQNATEPRWSVTGILISPERRLAMINDRLIGVGEKVDGARVKSIYGTGVELEIDGRSIFLKSLTSSLRRAN